MSFIGIDLGTSFIKACPESGDGEPRHMRRMPFRAQLESTAPLACEFDPQEILAAVPALIAKLAPHALDCEGTNCAPSLFERK